MPQDNFQKTGNSSPGHGQSARTGRELIAATRPYVEKSTVKSWWLAGSTFGLMLAALTAAGMVTWWPLRVIFSILGALLMVRAFIIFHDYLHGAILKGSRVARWVFHAFGALMLTPTRSWLSSHNYHHGHVGQVSHESAGAFPLITARMWQDATWWQRLSYRAQRSPFVVLLSYPIVFGLNITLMPLLKAPRKHIDSLTALLSHFGLIAVLWAFGGFSLAFFVILLPMTLAASMGCYLFFAQHSFRRMQVAAPEEWNIYRGAMESSSYMRMNRIMEWFTANIGYHHIHHLNVRIPFYRLPEVMADIPELQSPLVTTLAPGDIADCFRYALWDEDRQRMVSYGEASG